MRLLADENIFGPIVTALRGAGDDVVWARDLYSGFDDDVLLAIAFAENRIVVSEDRDFGELVYKLRLPAVGIVMAKVADLAGTLDAKGIEIAGVITAYADRLIGCMTVIEPGRVRQSPLPSTP